MADEKLSIIDHLEELRWRLLTSILTLLVLFPIGFSVSPAAMTWLKTRFYQNLSLQTTAPMEMLYTQMKLGLAFSIVGGFPVLAWQAWRFISPGLYEHERRHVSRFVFLSSFLFLLGGAFALFFIYPAVIRFCLSTAPAELVEARYRMQDVVSMATSLVLAFGVMFQLPIVVYLLAVTELVSIEMMKKSRPIVVVVILAMSAVLTPPDVVSQLSLGIPSMLLFEISLVVSQRSVKRKVAERRRREEEERLQQEEEERREREEHAAWLAAHPEEAATAEDDDDGGNGGGDDYSEYYDEFYDESYNYADHQETPKKKPGKWQVRGLRRDRRFMREALRKRPPRGRK
jgi:sec-independent protein translocase protein TatC